MTTGRRIDLNADVGEATDREGIAVERALLALVSSVNVACGGHAGDATSMRETVTAALAHGVRVGAHPSYPDRAGFGRRPMTLADDELEATLREQIDALVGIARAGGTTVRSVKAHGALYGEVGRGESAYAALQRAVRDCCAPGTPLVLPAGSLAVTAARRAGVPVLQEGFCDRAYRPDGGLVDRSVAGAVLGDPDQAARQAVGLALDGTVGLGDGSVLTRPVDTLCIHGDTPGALAVAQAVRAALAEAGVAVGPPPAGL